jgi:hypothetical protein
MEPENTGAAASKPRESLRAVIGPGVPLIDADAAPLPIPPGSAPRTCPGGSVAAQRL